MMSEGGGAAEGKEWWEGAGSRR